MANNIFSPHISKNLIINSAFSFCVIVSEKRSTQSDERRREAAISEYVHRDLLQLRTQSPLFLLQKLLINIKSTDADFMLQYLTSSLLSAIVSTEVGRNYFAGVSVMRDSGGGLLDNLLKSNLIEAQTKTALIDVAAKLSAHNFHRDDFIRNDLHRWAHEQLVENEYSGSEEALASLFRVIQNLATFPNGIYAKNECKQLLVLSGTARKALEIFSSCF